MAKQNNRILSVYGKTANKKLEVFTSLIAISIVIGLVFASFGVSAAGQNSQPACNDGLDNDADGRIDYPADPGCASTTDISEATA